MADAKDAWDQASHELRALGDLVRRQAEATGAPPPDPSEVDTAARHFADSVRAGVDSVSSTVQSPEFREQTRAAGASLLDALAASFAELSAAVRRGGHAGSPAEPGELTTGTDAPVEAGASPGEPSTPPAEPTPDESTPGAPTA
jgi:hypothetical protein